MVLLRDETRLVFAGGLGRWRAGVVLGGWLAGACSAQVPDADATIMDAGSEGEATDAGLRDAIVDAPGDADAIDLGEDGSSDGGDAAFDGGPVCIAASECVTSSRSPSGTCVERPIVDGAPCSAVAGGICLVGACTARTGCGDGYREPGPDPAREACDDGNTLDGDLCSATCTPTAEHVPGAMRGFDVPTLGAVDIAADGTGASLLVWTADDGTGVIAVHARRYDALGAPGEPIPGYLVLHGGEIGGTNLGPTVAGLAHGGWAIVYGALAGPTLRIVRADGTLGAETVVSTMSATVASVPRVAALADGTVVVVWDEIDGAAGGDPSDGIRARLYDEGGSALAAEMLVPTDASRRELEPSVATNASGDEWLVVWQQQPLSGAMTGAMPIHGRRYHGATPTDGSELDLVSESHQPFVTALHDDDYALAWMVNTTTVDVHERTVLGASPAYTMAADVTVGATMFDDTSPSVAAAGGDEVLAVWRTSRPRTAADLGATPGLTLTAEAITLRAHLRTSCAGEVSVAPARDRGVYVVWSERRAGRLTTDPLEDVMLEYLPLD